MITFQPINLEVDYQNHLVPWWRGHNAEPVHREILPRGWFAVAAGIKMAASFLYVAEGKIAVIEWTTTNPACAHSRDIVEAVRGLYAKLEAVAVSEGCVAVMSFVQPGTWEERSLVKVGYKATPNSIPHVIYAKPLAPKEEACPPSP